MVRPLRWLLAILPLATALIAVVAGVNLLPPRTAASETGRIVPWLLTWGLIGVTTMMALVVSAVLIIDAGDRRA